MQPFDVDVLALRQSVGLRFVTFDTKLEDAAKKLMPEAVA